MSAHPPIHADYAIRPATDADFDAILALNSEWVDFTSHLDFESLSSLHGQCAYHRVAESEDRVVAFLLALREGVDYDSPNYAWFDERGGAFLYIDRVIVDRSAQGNGIATMLYNDVIAFARQEQVASIVCELDIDPPNDASRSFHDSFGFREVGTQWVAEGIKRVSLREVRIS